MIQWYTHENWPMGQEKVSMALKLQSIFTFAQNLLKNAINIRNQVFPETKLLVSRYNSKVILSSCELCNNPILPGQGDTHHLEEQARAVQDICEVDGSVFHKNSEHNLAKLCRDCHKQLHKSGKRYARIETGEGSKLVEIK